MIERGRPWGSPVDPLIDAVVAESDADVAAHLSSGDPRPVVVRGGDLARMLGTPSGTLHAFPVDLLRVTLDGRHLTAAAHVVVRSRWGLWGPVVYAGNVGWLGRYRVVGRGHPNDGRLEVLEVSPRMSLRQRLGALARLRTGTHVPHPLITQRSCTVATWEFSRPLAVRVDGRRVGRATTLEVSVLPDAGVIHR